MISKSSYCMPELRSIFAELGLSQYLDDFIDQGFDTWQTILDITESDFDVLKVKLGHRRKLQRKIANSRGYSSDRALESRNTPPFDRPIEEAQKIKIDTKESGATLGTKRKYRRHPKPDENAPERPPSAYVIFSNKMREELKGRNLSFTEIAKLVGEKWQNLSLSQKELYEQQASTAKEKYNNELIEYKKTNLYKEYSGYLADFKARHSRQNSGETECLKRPKLEAPPIIRNSSVSSSTTSHHGDPSSSNSHCDSASSVSTPSTNCSWPRLRNPEDSPGREVPKLASLALSLTNTSNVARSPVLRPPTDLFKFREVTLNGSPPSRNPSRDQPQEKPPFCQQMRDVEIREGMSSPLQALPILQPSYQYPSEAHHSQVDKQDAMSMCPISNSTHGNRTSSAPAGPRILMEPSLDRSHHTSRFLEQKVDDRFERQLPPLIPTCISPKSRGHDMLKQDQISSKVFNQFICSSPMQIPPIRDLSDFNNRHTHKPMSIGNYEDVKFDPTGAQMKSSELICRKIPERLL
ncbi:putative hmg box protein [Erysiphe neolycopersici]|uniref:Putative hmg box protein n=1 Tax=Erysiphe neolycopersici TaxID=212602 RepID=A0A420I1W1_9PEZI|nr:putative hmg box protein [Erysiphe neolycopersici]